MALQAEVTDVLPGLEQVTLAMSVTNSLMGELSGLAIKFYQYKADCDVWNNRAIEALREFQYVTRWWQFRRKSALRATVMASHMEASRAYNSMMSTMSKMEVIKARLDHVFFIYHIGK